MCGVVGYFVSKNHRKYSNALEKAVGTLSHRGHHQGIFQDGNVGLGHTRLSILDLSSAANQPMTSYNGRYVISFNGQIYNYIEIAKALRKKIEACSDTRIILEAVAEFGIKKAVSLLNGMFAFALWDNEEKKLHLVRDSIGIKPLYWAENDDGYVFGSEIKALKVFPKFNSTLCSNGLQSYFQNKAVYGPHSIYEHCYKLLPGHILTLYEGGSKMEKCDPTVQNYSRLKTPQEADECFEVLLTESIKRHSRSDVPFSAFLSGGIDSSLIVSILAQNYPIKTYSIGYEEKGFDESKKAKKITDALGVEHNTLLLSPNNVFESLNKIPKIYDEPFADSSCLPTYLLSQEVSKYTKVAFSGDGADELFAGYPRYFNAVNQWEKIQFIPYFIRNKILKNIIHDDSPFIKQFAKFFIKNPEQSLPYVKKLCGHKTILDLFYSDNSLSLPLSAFSKEMSWDNHSTLPGEFLDQSNLRSLLKNDQKWRLPDEMLTKVDRASMQHSLEIRVPFLDNEIVAFSRSIPDIFLGNTHIQKILLRRLLSKYLPDYLFEGPKVGFHIPMKIWLKTHYKEWAQDLLFGKNSDADIFNREELKKLWHLYIEGETHLFYPLWSAIMYNQWARMFNF
jgi:asparagine synthase (glutamine-hydrolysing)